LGVAPFLDNPKTEEHVELLWNTYFGIPSIFASAHSHSPVTGISQRNNTWVWVKALKLGQMAHRSCNTWNMADHRNVIDHKFQKLENHRILNR
jgi:hypothetical protein